MTMMAMMTMMPVMAMVMMTTMVVPMMTMVSMVVHVWRSFASYDGRTLLVHEFEVIDPNRSGMDASASQ